MAEENIKCTIVEEKIFCNIKENPINVNVQEVQEKFNLEESSPTFKFNISENPIKVFLEKGGTVSDIVQFLQTLSDWITQEDLTSQVIAGKTDLVTTNNFYSVSLKVFINGIKEKDIIILTDNSFRLSPALANGDFVEVEFVKKIE